MIINDAIKKRRAENLNHLNRIQGQIETLKKYLSEGADCIDIAMLTTSIAKSFDSLRNRTMEGSIINQVLAEGVDLSEKQKSQIQQIIKLHNK